MAVEARMTAVYVDVEVPLQPLTAADCPPRLKVPTPLPEGTDVTQPEELLQLITIEVPAGSPPGCSLRLALEGGKPVDIRLPPGASPGDELMLAQMAADGSWRAAPRLRDWSELISSDGIEAERVVHLPDRAAFQYEVPSGARPGQIISFTMLGGGEWGIKNVCSVPATPSNVAPELSGPLGALLKVIGERGRLDRLPVDRHGVLHVSIPFCAGFFEHVALGKFIAEECLSQSHISGAAMLATEIVGTYSFPWAVAQKLYAKVHPNIKLDFCVRDLSVDPLPAAGLVIARHPEVTKGGFWFQIMGSLIQCCRGLCVFATFYEAEMQTVLNMVDMYKREGTTVDVVENPHYDSHKEAEATEMRYIILVSAPSMC